MNKIFFTSLCILWLCFSYNYSFANTEPRECLTEQYCSIENETRVELDAYVESNTRAIKNLSDQIRARGTQWQPIDGLENFRKYIVWSLNNSVDWRRFDDLFDFYILSGMQWTMPSSIYRDYEKLSNEWERITKLINMLADWLYDDMIITNSQLCAWITTRCSIDWTALNWKLSVILWKLYENNLAIKNYYHLSALWKEDKWWDTSKVKTYFLIPSTGINGETDASVTTSFQNVISRYYWANAIAQCNQCQWGSFKKIQDTISSISSGLQDQDDAFKSWKDSWYLLIGAKESSRKVEKERQLLARELSRQWIKTENADVILQNLDRYNNPENENGRVGGFTWGNNYISNTFKSLITNTTTDLDTFESAIQSEYNERNEANQESLDGETIGIDNFQKSQSNISTSIEIADSVAKLYKLQLEHAQKDDILSNKLINNIVWTHNSLVETTEIMNKTIPISIEVCNSQGFWLWKCSYWTHK